MQILITGGAGFIGSYLCERYAKQGHRVLCLDNFLNGNLMNVRHLLSHRNFKLINGDVRDSDLLEKLISDTDVIFHLAAQIHVDRSVIEPKMTTEVNVLGTQNVLEAARRYDVQKIIHASTSEVYGSAQYTPMDESHVLNPPHPYGASKVAADRMCYAYIETYGLNITIVRSFNTYGPRQKDTGYGGAISLFTRRVLANMPPIIYGDGLQTRDYTYIEDMVRAYDLILNHSEPIQEPINIGSGTEISIIDLANLIIKLCNKEGEIKPVHIEPRPGEVRSLVADTSKAKKILGWQHEHSIERGLEAFIEWYRTYKTEEWVKPG